MTTYQLPPKLSSYKRAEPLYAEFKTLWPPHVPQVLVDTAVAIFACTLDTMSCTQPANKVRIIERIAGKLLHKRIKEVVVSWPKPSPEDQVSSDYEEAYWNWIEHIPAKLWPLQLEDDAAALFELMWKAFVSLDSDHTNEFYDHCKEWLADAKQKSSEALQ